MPTATHAAAPAKRKRMASYGETLVVPLKAMDSQQRAVVRDTNKSSKFEDLNPPRRSLLDGGLSDAHHLDAFSRRLLG